MHHRLITNMEQALGWEGSDFGAFAVGTLPDNDLAARMMTPERVLDAALRHAGGRPRLWCKRDGQSVHPMRYITHRSKPHLPSVQLYDPNALGALLDEGVTMMVDGLQDVDPTTELACRALGWRVGESINTVAFLTTGATTGYEMHWDDHDVIALQVAGTKDWEVRKPSRRSPTFHGAQVGAAYEDILGTPPEETLWSGTLHPGQIMYIPRGYWHQPTRKAMDTDGFSLHLSFRFTNRTGAHWLDWVADKARHDPFRDDLSKDPLAVDAAAHTRELADQAHELLSQYTPAMMMAERQRTAPPARHVRLGEQWAGLIEAVIAITDFPPQFEITDTEVIVRGAGKELTFSPAAEDSLRMLLSGQPVMLGPVTQQPDQSDKPDLRTLARTLMKENLCAPMTESLWSGCADLIPTAGR